MCKPVEIGYICASEFHTSQIYIENGFLTFAHKFHGFDFKINASMQFKTECCTKQKNHKFCMNPNKVWKTWYKQNVE